ncbi:MAG: hypothetical protein KME45_03395 [Stenomitos rutilans HA7619-LM2]|nr:hypothetical protein [Stenomitos rutilans HA7619-LM2]MBW4469430.1 hypothetical protein [Stenomitos rutilans HA7619-LM2]
MSQIQTQINAIATTPFTFGGAIDSIRQLAQEFQKLNQTTEQNRAAKEGAKVAAETAKAAQQLAKATAEQEKTSQQAARTETERLKTQKEAIQVDQQAVKLETEKARAIQATANAAAAQSRAQAAALRTQSLEEKTKPVEGLFSSLGDLANLAKTPIAGVAFAFNEATNAAQRLAQTGGQAFNLLIGQNVRLREQTLGLSALLANVQQVSIGGENVTDPVKAIQTVLPEVQRQIDQIRLDSLQLSGITSSELVESFKLVAQQANALGINLEQAEKVTIKLNASATTLGLPLGQAQTYIAQIANLQIDPTFNTLAKTLELNNEKARSLIAQGRLYEYIDQRTKALVAGQELAARGFAGLTSNVQEVFEVVTQKAGAPILDAILEPLNRILISLQKAQPELEKLLTSVADFAVGISEKVQTAGSILVKALQPLGEALGSVLKAGGESLGGILNSLADAFVATATAIAPLLSIVGELAKVFASFASTDIGRLLLQIGLLAAIVAPLVPTILAVVAVVSSAVGAITAVSTALPLLIGLLTPTAAGLGAVALSAALAAAPLVALAAALALIVTGFEAVKLAAVNDAIETLSESTNRLADESLNYAQRLKSLNDIEKNGGKLTEEQIALKKQLLSLTAGTKQSIEQQIADLKALQPANQEQANALKVQIALLEQRAKLLSGQANVGLGNRALQDLGKTKDLIDQSLKGAQTDLLNPAKAEDAAKRVQEFTQTALDAGRITRSEAAKNLEALQNNQGLELKTRLSAQKALTDLLQKGADEEVATLKTKEKTIESDLKAGRLSQIEGERQLTVAKAEELDKQLALNAEGIKRELELTGGRSSPRLVALRREEAELQGQRSAISEDGNRKRAQAEQTAADNELKILEGKRVSGKLSEEAFANESLAITKRRLALEQQELERQRGLLKPGDKAGQQAIDAQEAALNSKREAAEEQFQSRKLAIVERAQKKAEDAAKLSEISRNTEIDQLIAARQIRESEAGLLRVQTSRQTIAKELELEKEKTAALEKLPKVSDPVKEEERQQKIRASRIRTAELADSLVKNEIEQQEALFRVVSERLDRQAQAAKNAAEGQVQPLQAQLQLQDALSKSLENQNKLLEARKGLQNALTGFAESSLALLQKSGASEKDQQTATLLIAAQKFAALQRQQQLEQQTLNIQLRQNAAALEREKIQNRISQIQNQADQAQAAADLAKAKADPNARLNPEAIRAAELNLQAKQAAGLGLQLQGAELNDRGRVEAQTAAAQQQALQITQRTQTQQARSALIEALPDDGAKQEARFRLQQEVLSGSGFGVTSLGDINTDRIRQAAITGQGNLGLPGILNPLAAPSAFVSSPQVLALQQQLSGLIKGQTAIAPITSNNNSPQLQSTLDKLNATIEAGQARPIQATVNNTIAGPDASQVVDLATKRMTDNLIGVLGRVN